MRMIDVWANYDDLKEDWGEDSSIKGIARGKRQSIRAARERLV